MRGLRTDVSVEKPSSQCLGWRSFLFLSRGFHGHRAGIALALYLKCSFLGPAAAMLSENSGGRGPRICIVPNSTGRFHTHKV